MIAMFHTQMPSPYSEEMRTGASELERSLYPRSVVGAYSVQYTCIILSHCSQCPSSHSLAPNSVRACLMSASEWKTCRWKVVCEASRMMFAELRLMERWTTVLDGRG